MSVVPHPPAVTLWASGADGSRDQPWDGALKRLDMSVSESIPNSPPPAALGRRSFVGFVLGGATLVAAAGLVRPPPARADGIPSAPQIPEIYDLEDLQTDAALPTSLLITITINEDGTASFALPRMEVGQGITTSTAMIIADELDLPLDKVKVTLAPARPEDRKSVV